MNKFEREVLDLVQSVILGYFSGMLGKDIDDFAYEDKITDLFGRDHLALSRVLLDIHKKLGLPPQYELFTEFEHFKTMEHVVAYFYNLHLEQKDTIEVNDEIAITEKYEMTEEEKEEISNMANILANIAFIIHSETGRPAEDCLIHLPLFPLCCYSLEILYIVYYDIHIEFGLKPTLDPEEVRKKFTTMEELAEHVYNQL